MGRMDGKYKLKILTRKIVCYVRVTGSLRQELPLFQPPMISNEKAKILRGIPPQGQCLHQ